MLETWLLWGALQGPVPKMVQTVISHNLSEHMQVIVDSFCRTKFGKKSACHNPHDQIWSFSTRLHHGKVLQCGLDEPWKRYSAVTLLRICSTSRTFAVTRDGFCIDSTADGWLRPGTTCRKSTSRLAIRQASGVKLSSNSRWRQEWDLNLQHPQVISSKTGFSIVRFATTQLWVTFKERLSL